MIAMQVIENSQSAMLSPRAGHTLFRDSNRDVIAVSQRLPRRLATPHAGTQRKLANGTRGKRVEFVRESFRVSSALPNTGADR